MRFRNAVGDVVHLSYGTNVLPAEDVDGLVAQVAGFGDRLTRLLDTPTVGLGLWLPAAAAHRLAGDLREVERLRTALRDHGVEVVTLNCFPYAAFQGDVVKHRVYAPTWAEEARLDYTLAAARVLTALLPDDVDRGSVSTLPLAWRDPWTDADQTVADDHLGRLADGLAALEAETGRGVRVGIEPEPGCVIETLDQAVDRLARVDTDRIGLCLDLCHLAVGFEEPTRALDSPLDVVKAQVGAALVVDDPSSPQARAALAGYTEDRFLHQVRRAGDLRPEGGDDLPEALAGMADDAEWRVHFHVPVHADPEPPLRSSRQDLRRSLGLLVAPDGPCVEHLEVETYTWSVLPGGAPADDDSLARGLAAELAWVRDELVSLGLTPQEET